MLLYATSPRPGHAESSRAMIVAPAFTTRGHAISFIALLVGLILGPSLLERLWPADPSKIYKAIPLSYVNYHHIGETISAGGKIDVVVIGASDAWTALDVSFMQEELSKHLKRPARVVNLSTNWAGEDRHLQVLSDLLQRASVHLVLGTENDALQTTPHELAKFWWRGAASLSDLSRSVRAQFHFMSIVGLPRQLWARLISVDALEPMPGYKSSLQKMRETLGFLGEVHGWKSHTEPNEKNRRKLTERIAPAPDLPVEKYFYPGTENAEFKWQYYDYNKLFTSFTQKTNRLVKAHGGLYAAIAIPTHFRDAPLDRVVIRPLYAKQARDWPVIGISMTQLFKGMSFDEMKDFYSNESHLNVVGAKVFTRAMMPAVLKLYDQATTR